MLDCKNYYNDTEYMSVSLWKRFNQCELKGLKPFEPATDAMLLGSYVDAYVEGTLEEWLTKHPEVISSRGATKGQLKSEFKQADKICQFIDNDPVLKQFLNGQKQVIFTGEIGGVPFKGKLDSYHEHTAIADLKVMAKITDRNGKYIDFITPYGYDIQMAVYQELVYQNTGEKLPCYICAVTKENPINSIIVKIPQVYLDRALYQVESTAQRYYDIWKGKIEPVGCGVCDVCIANRKETNIITLSDILGEGLIV